MIDFAGVGLTAPDERLEQILRAWWHPDRILYADYPGFLTAGLAHLPRPYPTRREPPRLGVLNWPCQHASRWATCFHLVTGDQLTRIRAVLSPSESVKTNGPAVLTLADARPGKVVAPAMFMLPPRPIAQRTVGTTPAKELYLLELVDERYYWWAAGNQCAPDPTPGTWSELLATLFGLLAVVPTIDPVPTAFDPPDEERWAVGYQPLPVLIDAACRTVGLRVVRTTAGAVKLVRWVTAKAYQDVQVLDHEADRVTGGRVALADIGKAVPAAVAVVFGHDADATVELRTLLGLGGIGGANGVTNTVGQVKGDLPETADAAAMANWATEAAGDYYLWQQSDWEAEYRGVVPWVPSGAEDSVEWECVYAGEDAPLIRTRVRRPPEFDPNVYGGPPAAGGGALQICGTPMRRRLTLPDDTECKPCDVQKKDVEKYLRVKGVLYDRCGFRVTATNECGGSGADAANLAASGSGDTNAPAVLIETQGYSGSVPRFWNMVFCPNDCSFLIQWAHDCFYLGLFQGYWVGPPVSCDSGSMAALFFGPAPAGLPRPAFQLGLGAAAAGVLAVVGRVYGTALRWGA